MRSDFAITLQHRKKKTNLLGELFSARAALWLLSPKFYFRDKNGEMMCQPVADATTARIASLVSRQKSKSKKKGTKYRPRGGGSFRGGSVSVQLHGFLLQFPWHTNSQKGFRLRKRKLKTLLVKGISCATCVLPELWQGNFVKQCKKENFKLGPRCSFIPVFFPCSGAVIEETPVSFSFSKDLLSRAVGCLDLQTTDHSGPQQGSTQDFPRIVRLLPDFQQRQLTKRTCNVYILGHM